jgi:phosphatidate cytidylyltransferase
LAPRISPKKTVEGGLATFLGVGLGFWLLKLLFLPRISWTIFVFIVLGVGFLSQVGDLSESLIKRASGVKDSGSLIPGHGGILDRMDSFIFASPFLYYLLRFS